MRKILLAAVEALAAGKRVALSHIVASSGSLPMSRRSKLLMLPDGSLMGTVGGGCLEAEVCEQARQVLESGRPLMDRFVLTEEEAGEGGLNCGGSVRILTEALDPGPVEEVIRACLGSLEARRPAVLASRLEEAAGSPGKLLLGPEGRRTGSLGKPEWDDAAARLAGDLDENGDLSLNEIEGAGRLFLEPISVIPALVLFGGGHVSRQVAKVAAAAGFRVVVVDDRAEFADPARHPDADETLVLPFDSAVERAGVDEQTFLAIVTRGHQHDEVVLRQALRSPAAYVGMIGSARKVAVARKHLADEGFTRAELERLHAPIGLDIGAEGPEEIAVSIVAELIAFRRMGGHAASLRNSGGKKSGTGEKSG